ncbi:bifunctional folylpolyglutamate synthase/dihydrofolate synthase [Ruminiclostridium cellulolyticum]|uniref:tetrahydrofolate synthase n=1 Tax=Ruminiclostridium cellulolyticum (strain ATCC 35319 / DSM 5812 / JCM 6584 / H10) TaxID=394503 RepID=B8I1X5_RUMCH|nr:folylpolyglutamate synthase/dihydrofolate synthase family protein [Ruminiclostridium cellulolyticum]ACL75801.1 FolC bifunctional protein [Ruminiclostridium cellulolyticum H10]
MHYEAALEYLHGTLKFGSIFGLDRITKLLDLMGNPHKKLKFIHIAGTNGKGSTTAFISSILIEAGYRTGMFTSPYIQRFTERIKVDNNEISNDELAELISQIKNCIEKMVSNGFEHPTEFEIITAASMEYFYKKKCDIVVLEVGLGGIVDSTNVIDTPEASVVTSISMDHMDRLGETLGEIAYQKAGIIKQDGVVVLYPQEQEAEEVIERVSKEKNAQIHKVDFSTIYDKGFSLSEQIFDYKDYRNIKIGLLGDHQMRNAAVAIDTCELLCNKGFALTHRNILDGLEKTRWPGRLEIINKNPLVLIDGAHNLEGGQALNTALDKYFTQKKKIFVVGFLRDKDYIGIMDMLGNKADTIITVTPNNERAVPSAELAEILKSYSNHVVDGMSIENGLQTAVGLADSESVICAFGSLYMIGEIRGHYK